MSKLALMSLPLACLFHLQSCAPLDPSYTPTYSVYTPPVVVDYGGYHHHGGHHHHHDGEGERHYHPNNQWDKIAYDTVNRDLSQQDIDNLNTLSGSSKKNASKKKSSH